MPVKNIGKLFIGAVLTVVISFGFVHFTKDDGRHISPNSVLTSTLDADVQEIEQPDLAIEKVTLTKIKEPSESFNYHKYRAALVLKNHGGDIFDARIVLSGGINQKQVFVRNTDWGFSLDKNESYIIDNYEVIFDADFNGGQMTFNVEMAGELDDSNNSKTVEIFEGNSAIKDIAVTELFENGVFSIDYSVGIKEGIYEVFASNKLKFRDEDYQYREVIIDGLPYSYNVIPNAKRIIGMEQWQKKELNEYDARFLYFSDEPMESKGNYHFFVKVTDPNNGAFAVSDIVHFSYQEELNRADFARAFIELANIEIDDTGDSGFSDVRENHWYKPYVQTLVNMGLIDNRNDAFGPFNKMTREQAIKIVMDYYDADLAVRGDEVLIADVKTDQWLYPYIKSLKLSGRADELGESVFPKLGSTRNFLKYLVNAYR